MNRRSLFVFGLAGSLALFASSCASDDDDDTGTGGGGEGEFQEGELGSVTIGPDDPVVVAALQSISGDTASLGTDQVRAINMAMDERDGELLGHEIELLEEDDECSNDGGQAAAQRLVSEPQLLGVLGTSCSGAAVPAAELLNDENVVMISGSNTSPGLTSDLRGTEGENHQPNYFRTAHNDIIQGAAAAQYAYEELGVRTAATIHDGDPYTEGLATAFETSFTELGGEVVLATAISKGDTDMRPVLTEVAAQAPDLLYFPIFQPEGDFIAEQADEFPELEATDKLMGADGLLSDTFIALEVTEGMYFSGPARPEGSGYEDFVERYEQENGEAPIQAFHAHTYDAANILFDAIETVAFEEDDGTLRVDRQALLDEIAGTEGYEGLTGTLTCDEFGDCADPAIDVVQNSSEQVTIDEVRENILFTYEPPAEEG